MTDEKPDSRIIIFLVTIKEGGGFLQELNDC